MSLQRRRGQTMIVYPSKSTVDLRGNISKQADMDNPITVTAAAIPERGSRAEVPGQQQIDVLSVIFKADIGEVDVYSMVHIRGGYWDVVTPPQYHHGTRQVRHWTMEIRRRPD